ncbi:MAG: class I SAM-dependent methyltransferase [Candidatus Fermentibacter sp.]|nr:class I SAM-dependent methyltransferase [Candidatus Fermentibacter sp.]
MGYDPALHGLLKRAEETHPWFRARAGLVAHLLRKLAKTSASVLDEGCGTGWSSAAIARSAGSSLVVGTDITLAEAASARPRGVVLVRSDITAPPFREYFDALLILDVLEHFGDDRGVLVSASQALAPDGLLIVTVPAMPSLWSRYDTACGHFKRYTRRSLLNLLGDSGFEAVFCSHFMMAPVPFLAVSRNLHGAGRNVSIDEREFRPGRFVSSVLGAYLCVEAGLLRAGFRFPAGSSLVAAARRRTCSC